jgi:LysM repeat protein
VSAQVVTLPAVPPSVAVPSPRQVAVLPAKLAKDGFGGTKMTPHTGGGDPVRPSVTSLAVRTEAALPTEAAAVSALMPPQTGEPAVAPVGVAAGPVTSIPPPSETSVLAVRSPEASPSVPVPSVKQVAMLPPKLADASQAPAPSLQPTTAAKAYTVQIGDSLWTVAARHGLTVAQLAKANDLAESAVVHPGQQLCIATPSVYVDGEPLLSDAPASIVDGRMLAPFRAVVEQAGGSVVWEPETRQARAGARGKEIAVTVGSDVATVDGRPTPMGMAAVMGGSRVFVPLRFLGEALDMVLHYRDGVVRVAEGK